MYIREVVTQNRKTKTKYVSHRLVESVRTEDGLRDAPGHINLTQGGLAPISPCA